MKDFHKDDDTWREVKKLMKVGPKNTLLYDKKEHSVMVGGGSIGFEWPMVNGTVPPI